MNAVFKQDSRIGKLHTAVGKDVLVLQAFDGVDFVDDLFAYSVEALSVEENIDFDHLIGTHATIELTTPGNGPVYFDGIIVEAQWAGTSKNGNNYKFQLRPWLWLASKRRNQRIFHNKTAVDIVKEIFGYWGQQCEALVEFRLSETYQSLEYTVQYQESDFDFVRRMMQQFGISYYFKHELGRHALIVTDSDFGYDDILGASREFIRSDSQAHGPEEHFWEWNPKRHLTTGAVRLTDYNFKKPAAMMEVDHTGDAINTLGQIETYEYPGNYLNQSDGKTLSRLRTIQERSGDHRHEAIGNTTSLTSGMKVVLTGDHSEGLSLIHIS